MCSTPGILFLGPITSVHRFKGSLRFVNWFSNNKESKYSQKLLLCCLLLQKRRSSGSRGLCVFEAVTCLLLSVWSQAVCPWAPSQQCPTSLILVLCLLCPRRRLGLWPLSWTCSGKCKIYHPSKALVEDIHWAPPCSSVLSNMGAHRRVRKPPFTGPESKGKDEAYLRKEALGEAVWYWAKLRHLDFLGTTKNEHFPFFLYLHLGNISHTKFYTKRNMKAGGRVALGPPSLWLSLLIPDLLFGPRETSPGTRGSPKPKLSPQGPAWSLRSLHTLLLCLSEMPHGNKQGGVMGELPVTRHKNTTGKRYDDNTQDLIYNMEPMSDWNCKVEDQVSWYISKPWTRLTTQAFKMAP